MNVALHRLEGSANPVAVLSYEARRPRAVSVVVGHGYSSSKQNLDGLSGFLAAHGYAVHALDFPGHKLGASGGRLTGVDDLFDAMETVVRFARERGATTIYTAGHSMGAATALCVAARDPQLAGAISIATGYGRPTVLDTLAARGVVDLRSSYVDGLSLPELAHQWQPVLDRSLSQLAGRPTLFVAAERDAMVSQMSVEALFDHAPEPKTLVNVSSDHTAAGDNSRAVVLAWLNERHPRREADAPRSQAIG